jgi:hypothetical protein
MRKQQTGQDNFNPSFANIYVDEVDELHLEMMRTINIEAAKRAAFGTTFGAFLKFMRNDWKEKMGVLISKKGVDELLENSGTAERPLLPATLPFTQSNGFKLSLI